MISGTKKNSQQILNQQVKQSCKELQQQLEQEIVNAGGTFHLYHLSHKLKTKPVFNLPKYDRARYNGLTIAVAVNDNTIAISFAVCSAKDTFDRSEGRLLALQRLQQWRKNRVSSNVVSGEYFIHPEQKDCITSAIRNVVEKEIAPLITPVSKAKPILPSKKDIKDLQESIAVNLEKRFGPVSFKYDCSDTNSVLTLSEVVSEQVPAIFSLPIAKVSVTRHPKDVNNYLVAKQQLLLAIKKDFNI